MIFSIKPGIILGRMQLIKTANDKDFRYGKVFLVKRHWLGRKMVALDATNEEDGYPEIMEMRMLIDGELHDIDVNNILCRSLKQGRFFFGAKEG